MYVCVYVCVCVLYQSVMIVFSHTYRIEMKEAQQKVSTSTYSSHDAIYIPSKGEVLVHVVKIHLGIHVHVYVPFDVHVQYSTQFISLRNFANLIMNRVCR